MSVVSCLVTKTIKRSENMLLQARVKSIDSRDLTERVKKNVIDIISRRHYSLLVPEAHFVQWLYLFDCQCKPDSVDPDE